MVISASERSLEEHIPVLFVFFSMYKQTEADASIGSSMLAHRIWSLD